MNPPGVGSPKPSGGPDLSAGGLRQLAARGQGLQAGGDLAANVAVKASKTMAKSWKNYGKCRKTMEKTMGNIGKPWNNYGKYRKIMEKTMENIGKSWNNYGKYRKIMEKLREI